MADQAEKPDKVHLSDREIFKRLLDHPEVQANLEWIQDRIRRSEGRGMTEEKLRRFLRDES